MRYDEDGRWLHLDRGGVQIIANLGEAPAEVRLTRSPGEVLLLTHDDTVVGSDAVVVPAHAAVVIAPAW